MNKYKLLTALALVILGISHTSTARAESATSTEIHIKLASGISDTALSGRVFVMFDRDVYGQPAHSETPDESIYWFSTDADGWASGTDFVMSGDAYSCPFSLAELPEGDYAVQAVFDINTIDRDFAFVPGNIYSDPVAAMIRSDDKNVISLTLEYKVEEEEIHETGFIKELSLESKLLTDYLGRPTSIKAMVVLPPSYYHTPEREYATVFVAPGFGSRHTAVLRDQFQIYRYGMNSVGEEKIFVFLDQECPLGVHVFANSENNGPWAAAFVEEYLPHLEKTYRVYRDPSTRFFTGQSSGAWAGLWLQINYPDQFGGVWACSPDPVDFESFLGVNIYEPEANLLFGKAGDAIELNRFFSDANRVVGDGWVMSTFEAVFSPRGEDGRPMKLWDRDSGKIDPEVAQAWKNYDLRLILQDNWGRLAPKLAGKIHIFVADDDPYGLDGPVKSLKDAMSTVEHDMELVIFDEGGHDLWTNDLRQRIHAGMDEKIAQSRASHGQ